MINWKLIDERSCMRPIALLLLLSSFGLTACSTSPSEGAGSEAEVAAGKEVDTMIKDAEADTMETEVKDYTVTDYTAFNPAGIVVHFDFEKATLSPRTVTALNQIVAGMKKDPLATITIRGHADKQGDKSFNDKLSARRAKVITDYLLSHGIEAERLKSVHLGSSEPVDDANRVTAYKKNRRGDFNIFYEPSSFGPAK